MAFLIIILFIVLFLAVYPLIRDALRKRYQPELEFSLALELIIAGKKEAALEKLKGIVKRNSEFVDAYFYLSTLYLEKGDFNTALAIGERLALRRNLTKEKEKKILKHLAHLYIQGKRTMKAISILEELAKIESDPESLSSLFALYLKEENFTAAEELLPKIAKMGKDKLPFFYAELGKNLLKKDEKKGLAYLEKGKNLENPLPSLFYLAQHYAETNKPENAIAIYHQIIEKNPNYFRKIKEKVEEIYYSLGHFEKLEEIYGKWLRAYPQVMDFFLALSEIYLKKEMPEAAIKTLEQYRGEERPYLLHLLLAHLFARRLDKAQEILENLIKKEEESQKERNCSSCGTKLQTSSLFCPNCLLWCD